ncbi:MAG: hypothetical protein ABI554_04055 [Flavobacterium sp.]
MRFTLTRHNTKADIDLFTDVMGYHLPKAIEEEGDNVKRVYKEFGFNVETNNDLLIETKTNENLIVENYKSINDIAVED